MGQIFGTESPIHAIGAISAIGAICAIGAIGAIRPIGAICATRGPWGCNRLPRACDLPHKWPELKIWR